MCLANIASNQTVFDVGVSGRHSTGDPSRHQDGGGAIAVLRQNREAVLKTVVAQSFQEMLLSAFPSVERSASGVGHGRHGSGTSSPASDDRDDGQPGGSDCARAGADLSP
jgi:hypothetical protein